MLTYMIATIIRKPKSLFFVPNIKVILSTSFVVRGRWWYLSNLRSSGNGHGIWTAFSSHRFAVTCITAASNARFLAGRYMWCAAQVRLTPTIELAFHLLLPMWKSCLEIHVEFGSWRVLDEKPSVVHGDSPVIPPSSLESLKIVFGWI